VPDQVIELASRLLRLVVTLTGASAASPAALFGQQALDLVRVEDWRIGRHNANRPV
jgi:hypothetical protein